MQRQAAVVPRPRLNLIRYHGVLAPNAKLRPQIIPSTPDPIYDASDGRESTPHHLTSVRMSWARLLKRLFDIDIELYPIAVAS